MEKTSSEQADDEKTEERLCEAEARIMSLEKISLLRLRLQLIDRRRADEPPPPESFVERRQQPR